MNQETYIEEHIKHCNAQKRVGISARRAKIECAKGHYKHQLRKGFPLDPNRSYKE